MGVVIPPPSTPPIMPKIVEEEEPDDIRSICAELRAAVARLPRASLEMIVALTPREASNLAALSARAKPAGTHHQQHPMAFLATTFIPGSVALVDSAIAEAFAWPLITTRSSDEEETTVSASSSSLAALRIEVQCLALQIRMIGITASNLPKGKLMPSPSSRKEAANALRRVRSILSGSGRTWPHVVSTS